MGHLNEQTAAELHTLGEVFRAYGGRELALSTIRKGGDVLDFHRAVSEHVGRTSLDRAMGLDLRAKDLAKYSLSRAIRACLTSLSPSHDAPFEFEVSAEIERQTGRASGMLAVPWSVFTKDFNVGSSTQAGALTGAPVEGGRIADPMLSALALAKVGCVIAGGFKGDFTVPRFSAGVTGSFLTEVDGASESSPVTAEVPFQAHRCSAYVEPSRQALIQSVPALESYLRRNLIASAMVTLENGAINGAGTGAEMNGLRSNSSIGTVAGGTAGAQLTFAHLADLEAAPASSNAPEVNPGFILNSKTRRWLRTQPRGTNLPYVWEGGDRPLLGYRAAVTNNVPSNLTKGSSTTVCSSVLYSSDWSLGLLALFGAPDVTVDPVTLAATGQVRITLNVYADFGALQPGAFAKMDDALTT